MRHPALALLLSKVAPVSEVKADSLCLERAINSATQTALAAEAEAAGAIADDRRKQEELKRQRLAVKVPCSVCHRPGHPAKDCFMTNNEKREQFLKKASPSVKAAILKRVVNYEKNGKLLAPGQYLGAVAGQSDLYPGLEDSGLIWRGLNLSGRLDVHSILDGAIRSPRGNYGSLLIVCQLQTIREIAKHIETLLQLAPVMVRTSLEDLKDWASGLGLSTRALIRAVESYGALLFAITGGYGDDDGPSSGYVGSDYESYSDSDSDYGDDPAKQDGSGSMPDLASSDDGGDAEEGDESESVPDLASSSVLPRFWLTIFFLELFAFEDNHILDTYCTLSDTCFIKDWAGKQCYGNPPFDHDIILKCFQKALADFDRDPANTKFLSVLPKLTKAIRPSVKPTGTELAKEVGSLVWSDTCGPFRISAGGYRWFALFVDDSTTWIRRYFLKQKSDYPEAFKMYIVEVKRRRSGMGLPEDCHMVLHTDGDSTMIAGHTAAFCKERGIEQRHGSPYLHENQARVERSHRDVQAMARALLLASGFGVEMWPLAARHVVYILNRIFRRSLNWTSAYYLINKKHADLSHLRIFGRLAYPFIDPSVREHKLSNRDRELRYVGHSEVSSAYLLYDHDSGKVVNSGMVTFSERLDKLGKVVTTWDPSALAPLKTNFMATALDAPYRDPLPTVLETPVLEQGVYLPEDDEEVMAVVKVEASDGAYWVSLSSYLEPGQKRLSLLRACPTYGHSNAHYPLFTEVRAVTGKGDSEEAMICGRAIAPHAQPYCVVLLTNFIIMDLPAGDVQFPPAHPCLGVKSDTAPTKRISMLPEGVTEPKGPSQVLTAPDVAEWPESIQNELEALVQIKGALRLMKEEDVPPGVKLLDMSLILKVKLDKHRQLLKRKSRICVRGNKQEYGVDYVDTFALCTQLSSITIAIVLALNLGLVVHHMDVDTAFLNSVLEEDLYVRLPRGLVYGGCRCVKLLKAVYGLKQAGKEWFDTSDAFIMGYDSRMQRSDVEPCLYFIKDTELMLIILAYVTTSLPRMTSPEHFVALKQVVRYLKGTKDHELVLRAA
eukprot:gene11073-biopygen11351